MPGTATKNLKAFKKKTYVFAFCEGLIFWYAIEKLFMQSIGLSLETIVVIGIIAQAGKMVFEMPSSVLADRWNRRNTLLLGTATMILASLLLPLATAPLNYTLFVLLWTIYFAFKSGTDTAFMYDSLKHMGQQKAFQPILARYRSAEYAGLIISGLTAGGIASLTNLQVPFWLTILPLSVGMFALLRLKEPPLDRSHHDSGTFWQHAPRAWRDIRQNALVWVVLLYAVLFALLFIWYEYYQVYGLAVKTPEVFFGSLMAVMCLGLIAGSEVVHKVKITPRVIIASWVAIFITHVGGLAVGTFASFLAIIFVTMTAIQILNLSFINTINHSIPSNRRATVISLGGSASQFIFLGLALLLKIVIEHHGVQAAFAVASLPLIGLGIADVLRRVPWLKDSVGETDSLAKAEVNNQESIH